MESTAVEKGKARKIRVVCRTCGKSLEVVEGMAPGNPTIFYCSYRCMLMGDDGRVRIRETRKLV